MKGHQHHLLLQALQNFVQLNLHLQNGSRFGEHTAAAAPTSTQKAAADMCWAPRAESPGHQLLRDLALRYSPTWASLSVASLKENGVRRSLR